ncbi:MAG: hypothetical protein KJ927_02895, partial [Candidatus Eisenbacteria bacterium]|nr:hypothetical protein [Candidatus Eisenbacteria bacterium]
PEGAGGIEGEGKGNTFAADLGLLYRPTNTPVSLSAVVQNLGPNIVFLSSDDSQPIGRNLRLGLGLYLMETEDMGVLASFDFNKSLVYSNEKPIYNWGAEWAYRNVLALRAGYIHDKQGEIIDPTFGFGLAYHKFTFEYASVPQAEGLDRVSKFSINYRF